MNKLKQSLKLFLAVLGFMSFISILGTAGASDLGRIDVGQLLVRAVPALVLLVISFVGQVMIRKEE